MGRLFGRKGIGAVFKPIEKIGKPIIKNAAPIIGSAIGTAVGGPAGGMIGGMIGGSTQRGSGNKLAGMINGAKIGSLYTSMAPMAGEFMGLSPSSTGLMSSITGLNQPSLLNQLGMSSAPGIGGGFGLFGNVGTQGFLQGDGFFGGLLQHAPSFFSKNKDKDKESADSSIDYDKYYNDRPYSIHGSGLRRRGSSNHLYDYQHLDREDSYSMPHHDVAAGALLNKIAGTNNKKKKSLHEEFMVDLIRPTHQKPLKRRFDDVPVERRFAKGGFVNHNNTGYIKEGDTGGQDDDVDMVIPDGAYVMNATDVSLLGDGSSSNGAKKLMHFEHSIPTPKRMISNFDRGGYTKPYDDHQYGLQVKVSNDEYVLSPHTVTKLGNGDNRKGAKVLDKMREKLRSQKGVKKILPPKSRDFQYYLRGSRRAVLQ